MPKLIKITVSLGVIYLLGTSFALPGLAFSQFSQGYKNPCLKNNNGIGNNHEIYVELPTHSLTLNDSQNKVISIRIDPGNRGQMSLFKDDLVASGFNTEAINFVINQITDAEIKVKNNSLKCSSDSQVLQNYVVFPD